jgi:hypothetical protein
MSKPHAGNAGYVCELKAKLGGHIVVYDRAKGCDIDAGDRWIVMHEPSSLHIAVASQRLARDIMQGIARATTRNEALRFADILPRAEDTPAAALAPAKLEALLDRWWNATDPAEERKLLRELFGLEARP